MHFCIYLCFFSPVTALREVLKASIAGVALVRLDQDDEHFHRDRHVSEVYVTEGMKQPHQIKHLSPADASARELVEQMTQYDIGVPFGYLRQFLSSGYWG